MRVIANKKIRSWLALVLASAGLAVLPSSSASADPVTVDLCANEGTWTVTGSVDVPIWGFVLADSGACPTAAPTLPGPILDVNAGDVVTMNLSNDLPAGHDLEFEIPGIALDAGPTDGSEAITFTASDPGIYLYQSGGDAGRQEAMGLYGALIVRPATSGQAYDDASTAYDVEAPLVISQLDPNFNAAPETFDMLDYLATYWLINGKAYPDTSAVTANSGDMVLLRYVNAGYDNSSMMLFGAHQTVVARDAHLLNNPFLADAETIPAGATEDTIVTVPSYAPTTPCGFPLFNRNLHVTNGSESESTYETPGGMMTFIAPTGTCPP